MRNSKFENKRVACASILKRINKEIKKELIRNMQLYVNKNKIELFKNNFLYKNILGIIDNNEIIYTLNIS